MYHTTAATIIKVQSLSETVTREGSTRNYKNNKNKLSIIYKTIHRKINVEQPKLKSCADDG